MRRAAFLRYGGLAGSLLLAVAAYRGGAGWHWHPTMTPRTILAGTGGVLVPVCWLLGTALMIGAWLLGRGAIPSARWAYVTAALWVVPLLLPLPLGSYDAFSYACQGWQQSAGLDPYSGGVDVLGCPWSDAVAPTWRHVPAPYGPVFLVLAGVAARLGGTLAGVIAVLRVVALLGLALTAACLPVLARRAGVPLSRAVWLFLACPIVAVHLISGAHNDAVMVGVLVAGLAVMAHGSPRYAGTGRDVPPAPAAAHRPDQSVPPRATALLAGAASGPVRATMLLAAGVLFGLAIGVKVTAIVVLPFAILLAAPAGAPPRALVRPAAYLVGAAVATIAAVSMAAGLGLGWVAGLSGSGVSVQWTAPSTAVGMTVDLVGGVFGQHWNAVPTTRVLGVAALAVALVVLWWRARGGDPLLGAGLALAATVVLAPVFHPWYATWPLAVLAATLPRDTPWLVVPCAVAAALCLPDGYNLALAVKVQGAIAMTALVVVLAVRGARTIRRHGRQEVPA